MSETIREDVTEPTSNDTIPNPPDDPVEAMLWHINGGEMPTENAGDAQGTEEPQSQDTPEDDAETESAEDRKDPEAPRSADDTDVVVVKVGEEEHQVSVKDLKRLFGQEASLTRKSQETAELQRRLQEQANTYTIGLEKMTEAAKARWGEYENIDYLLAQQNMTPEGFAQLRQDAAKAYQDYKFYNEELAATVQKAQNERVEAMRDAARQCVATLTRAPTDEAPNAAYIEGWNEGVYRDMRTFALSMGADAQTFDGIVDPVSIKLINMAMKYHQAEQRAKTLKASATVPTSPKKVPTATERRDMPDAQSSDLAKMQRRLSETGHVDDAADVFLQRLKVENAELRRRR